MNSITIITIVVVALLTVIIFGLTWLSYCSCIRAYDIEVSQGKYDTDILDEYRNKKKNKGAIVGIICSYLALAALLGLFITGIVYKVSGDNFTINNQTALVIKSGSMSDFYDDTIAEKYLSDKRLQFDVGDICIFETVGPETELVEGDVYGYKQKDIIITHRLVSINEGFCEFRGDNNPASDVLLVKKSDVIYHYLGNKIPGLGSFVLYAQSYFGIWSLVGVTGLIISSEVVYHKITVINKKRNEYLGGENNEN